MRDVKFAIEHAPSSFLNLEVGGPKNKDHVINMHQIDCEKATSVEQA